MGSTRFWKRVGAVTWVAVFFALLLPGGPSGRAGDTRGQEKQAQA
jgi:hypothetical protein